MMSQFSIAKISSLAMTLLGEVYFLGLLLDWMTKWTSLSPDFLPLQDLPPTRSRAFLCHREAHRRAARPQRQRFVLRKGTRIIYQMVYKKALLPGQNYMSIRRINTIVPFAITKPIRVLVHVLLYKLRICVI